MMEPAVDFARTGPAAPMGRLLRQYWQPLALAEAVAPGGAIPVRLMNEDLTLYRGRSGAPYLVADRCAHRRTLLHTGWVEDECLRCMYHGWKYDGTGQCVEMPAEDESFPAKVRVTSYPAQEYAGLIFAYLGEGTPPPLPRRAELDRPRGVKWTEQKFWPCNWFQRLENALDSAHVSFVHRASDFGAAVSSLVPTIEAEEMPWGMQTRAWRTPDNVRVNELTWPNLIHITTPVLRDLPPDHPWSDLFNWYVPIDDENSALFSARAVPIEGAVAEEFERRLPPHRNYNPVDEAHALFTRQKAAADAIDPVAAQDYLAVMGQGPFPERHLERLGRSDVGIILLRQLFRREMEALQAGQPGKTWQPFEGFSRLPVPPSVPPAPELEMAR